MVGTLQNLYEIYHKTRQLYRMICKRTTCNDLPTLATTFLTLATCPVVQCTTFVGSKNKRK